MAFQIPMGQLVKELMAIRKNSAEWDPDGQIEWDITVFILSTELKFKDDYHKKFFLNIKEARSVRDYINEKFGKDTAKVLKITVKLNRQDKEVKDGIHTG